MTPGTRKITRKKCLNFSYPKITSSVICNFKLYIITLSVKFQFLKFYINSLDEFLCRIEIKSINGDQFYNKLWGFLKYSDRRQVETSRI